MMKRMLLLLLITAAVFFTGCPASLVSGLGADLVIMLGRFNSTAVTDIRGALGGSIEVPVLITDQNGGEVAGTYNVTFTLSTDADLSTTGDNIDAGTIAVTAGTETVAIIEVPASAAAAVYYLFGVLDAAGDTVTNNNSSSIQVDIGAADNPDLEIAVGSSPGWADPGTSVTIGYAVYNTGYKKVAAGTSFTVEFTVNLSTVDTVLGTDTITLAEDLHPRDFIPRQLAVTLPTLEQMAADAGETIVTLDTYNANYTVTVDTTNTVTEIVEGGTDTFTVVSGNRKPDLVMNDIIMPDGFVAAKTGGPVNLTLEIINNGRAATGEYGIDLYIDFDQNGTFDGSDAYIKQWAEAETPSVPFDTSGSGNNVVYLNTAGLGLTYPVSTACTCDIRAEIVIDVDEYATGNNDTTEVDVDFVEALYNLSMKYMSSTLASAIDEASGGTIPLSYILKNDGEEAVTADFDVTFYASADGTLDTGTDIDLGTDTVTAEAPAGGVLTESFDAAFPSGQGGGFYTVFWVIDSGSAVSETDENDNDPDQAEECYVFVPVSDGSTNYDCTLLTYKPYGTGTGSKSIYMYLYASLWGSYSNAWGSASNPGDLYDYIGNTLTPGSTCGIWIDSDWYSDTPVAFILVPDHVTSLPAGMIPSGGAGQDGYEENNSTATAYALPDSLNPFFGFVTCWVDEWIDPNDYFTFDVT